MVRQLLTDLKDRIPNLYHNQGYDVKAICKLSPFRKPSCISPFKWHNPRPLLYSPTHRHPPH
ncbi:hypothetical protein BOTBODRAFT_247237 [Botryobasidium botryosum FD-172 SS1]|uniref:Uncharacterized protein n=1 Tax=Botryobasidium botryosum (strain FD-172 SS1) TaxID=930990 RepID=A0A067M4J9_BOTB1|nr:hypothetical protein BOTBODRAFT_247237 [Botryobasidium botryosum FD-172 SS1]